MFKALFPVSEKECQISEVVSPVVIHVLELTSAFAFKSWEAVVALPGNESTGCFNFETVDDGSEATVRLIGESDSGTNTALALPTNMTRNR